MYIYIKANITIHISYIVYSKKGATHYLWL